METDKIVETGITRKEKLFRCLQETAVYFAVFSVTLILFLCLKPLIAEQEIGAIAQAVTLVGIGVCIAFGSYLYMTKRQTGKTVVLLLLVIGYLLRLGYILYTPAAVRQHDTFSGNHDGHEAYAWTLFDTGKLPTTNEYQFYHPPLNALLQSWFMHFLSGIAELFGIDCDAYAYGKPEYVSEWRYFLFGGNQVLSLLYSCITCVVMLKILRFFPFSEKTRVLLAAFVILFPRNIQMSGQLNNDPLSFLFSILALYFALKWWKVGKRLTDILLCGGSVGLGMMTKFSSATVCLPIAGIFIYEFVRTLQKHENALPIKKIFLQYGLFLCVCAPIGLWFQVYAHQRFSQPFGYVFDNLTDALYTGEKSFFERFVFPLDLSEFFGSIFCRPFDNYYVFHYVLRSSIFGEFHYWRGYGFALASVVFAYMVVVLLLIALAYFAVRVLRRRKQGGALWSDASSIKFADFLFVFLLLQSQALSQMYFNLAMPYGCTMDFRYVLPSILAIGLLIGYTQKALDGADTRGARVMSRLLTIATVGFLCCSSLFYSVCI